MELGDDTLLTGLLGGAEPRMGTAGSNSPAEEHLQLESVQDFAFATTAAPSHEVGTREGHGHHSSQRTTCTLLDMPQHRMHGLPRARIQPMHACMHAATAMLPSGVECMMTSMHEGDMVSSHIPCYHSASRACLLLHCKPLGLSTLGGRPPCTPTR